MYLLMTVRAMNVPFMVLTFYDDPAEAVAPRRFIPHLAMLSYIIYMYVFSHREPKLCK
jgi:hypothetical protein